MTTVRFPGPPPGFSRLPANLHAGTPGSCRITPLDLARRLSRQGISRTNRPLRHSPHAVVAGRRVGCGAEVEVVGGGAFPPSEPYPKPIKVSRAAPLAVGGC